MVDTKVETIARLAQWKIESFGQTVSCKRSDPFKIGIWNWYAHHPFAQLLLYWLSFCIYPSCALMVTQFTQYGFLEIFRHLSVERSRSVYLRLFPEPSRVAKDQPPVARFVIRVTNAGRRPFISPSMF